MARWHRGCYRSAQSVEEAPMTTEKQHEPLALSPVVT